MLAEDAALLGLALPEQADDPLFAVDPDNMAAVETFCRCATQWRHGAMGGLLGLDYPGVNVVLNLTTPRAQRASVFADVQVMERAAMAVLNKAKGAT